MKMQSLFSLGLFGGLLLVVLTMALMGCPQSVTPQESQMAEVKLTLVDDALADKAMTNDQMQLLLKDMKAAGTQVRIIFMKQEQWQMYGMYGETVCAENVPLDANGQPTRSVFAPRGYYHMIVQTMNDLWQPMFNFDEDVSLGYYNQITVTLSPLNYYHYQILVADLYGDYCNDDGYGQGEAFAMDKDGHRYVASWWWDGYRVVMEVEVPLYAGWLALVATDLSGYDDAFDVFVSPLRQNFDVTCSPSSIVTPVAPRFVYGFESEVIANGQLYPSVQEAIQNTGMEPVDIMLFEGVYSVGTVVIPYGKSVSFRGQGPKSILRNEGAQASWGEMTQVIYASGFGGPFGHTEMGKSIAKGGSWMVSLSDLTVEQRSQTDNYYSDAAILLEGGIDAKLRNVVVLSANRGLAVNYGNKVSVDHCVFKGLGIHPDAGAEFSYMGQQAGMSRVANSIIVGYSLGIGCGSNDAVETRNCDFFNVQVAHNQGDLWLKNCINADPLLDSDYLPKYGSPCIGAGTKSSDIGLVTYTKPTDANGHQLPVLEIVTLDDGTMDVAISRGDYFCIDGGWYPPEQVHGGSAGEFFLAYSGATSDSLSPVEGTVYNISASDRIAWGWDRYYSGEHGYPTVSSSAFGYDDPVHIFLDGKEITGHYDGYWWLLN